MAQGEGILVDFFEAKGLTKAFGGLVALDNINLRVESGELIGLIGPNGAGKTSFFHLITGVLQPTRGEIRFRGRSITGRPAEEVARSGIARTFQNLRVFGRLSVLENVLAGCGMGSSQSWLADFLCLPAAMAERRRDRQRAGEILAAVGLAGMEAQLASSLPYGHQRRLEIARALATKPRLLLLDEPTAGMNPSEAVEMVQLITNLHRAYDLAIMIVDHNMSVIMNLCQRVTVLEYGKQIALGTPAEIQAHPEVIRAYLGVEDDEEDGAIAGVGGR